ncbi:MAG TPA: PAS domain-containing protein, partial [Candidatus Thermoplasmatota archaeon]|nr:PAS domain-containing protein [Candidatus Thermoplasmatota archaeon]
MAFARLESLTRALAAAATPPEVAERATTCSAEALGAGSASLYVLTSDGARLQLLHAFGYPTAIEPGYREFPLTSPGPAPDAIRAQEPVFIPSPQEWDARYPSLVTARKATSHAFATAPLLSRGRVLGALHLSFPSERVFSPSERAFLMTVAHLCAQALDRASLIEQEQASRRQAERALKSLRDRQAHDQFLLDESTDIIARYGPDGTFAYVSPAVTSVLGFYPGELVGTHPRALLPPSDLAALRAAPPLPDETGAFSLVHRALRKDGGVVWLEARWKQLVDPSTGKPVGAMSVSRDITRRVETLEALQASETRLEESHRLISSIIEGVPDPIFVKDHEGRYVVMNAAAAAYVGRDASEAVGRSDAELFPKEIAERLRHDDLQALARPHPTYIEEALPRADGEERFLFTMKAPLRGADGAVAGLVGIARDVTDRIRAERSLREANALLTSIIESTSDIVFVLGVDRRFALVNGAAERLVGLPRAEILGKRPDDFFPPPVSAVHEAEDRSVFSTGRPNIVEELLPINGEMRNFITVKSPLRDSNGQVTGLLGIARDVTAMKRAERETETLRQSLAHTEKLAALGSLVSGVAHEIRTPLT